MIVVHPYRWNMREAAFFCIGMAIVPVFWVWWTFQKRFTWGQRMLALAWTKVWLGLVVSRYEELAPVVGEALAFWPLICAAIAIALWVWLLARIQAWPLMFWIFLITGGVWHPAWREFQTRMQDHGPDYLLQPFVWIAIPAVLHLILEPIHHADRSAAAWLERHCTRHRNLDRK